MCVLFKLFSALVKKETMRFEIKLDVFGKYAYNSGYKKLYSMRTCRLRIAAEAKQ